MQILLYEAAYQSFEAELTAFGPDLEFVRMQSDGQLQLRARAVGPADVQAEVAWANSQLYLGGPVRDFMIHCLKSEHLRWFQSSAAGFEHPVFQSLQQNGVRLTNTNAGAVAIAEFVMARVMEAFHPVAERRAAQAATEWARLEFREISRTNWLVIGMGNIGSEIARRAQAFGADVIGVRRRPRGDEPASRVITPDALATVLGDADVIVLAAATNPQSTGMVDQAFLARLKADSVLVNIGRGALIDEAALLQSLDDGRPGRAILDVFDQEPLPSASAFWSHPRVWVTAHTAAYTAGTRRRGGEIFIDNLDRYLDGRPLEFQVTDVGG